MPIVGPTSYHAVTQQFINHWIDANIANGGVPIQLAKEETGTATDPVVADLAALLVTLGERRDDVEDVAQDIGLQRATVVGLRTFMLLKMNDFNRRMRADFASTTYGQNLENVPSLDDGRDPFMKPLRLTSRLWFKLNAWLVASAKPEMKTVGDYTQTAFASALEQLRVQSNDLEEREQQWGLDIKERNKVQEKIYRILKVYRLKIPSMFNAGEAIVQSLPALTPVPGSTPAAPGLEGGWNATANQAEFEGTASPTAGVVQHQLRGCPQADFDENLETVIATIAAGEPLEFETTWGLTAPGATASYRLVAMTADGHEKGSEPVVVTRPL